MFDCPNKSFYKKKIQIYNEYISSLHYQVSSNNKKLKATKEERQLHTICENLWRRLEYQGLELEDDTKKPHCGKPILGLALYAAAPEN